MDIVLGVSMTPTTVRMVLVEGKNADGVTVDNDTIDVASAQDSANAAPQVVSAVLGTRESAQAGGHRLKSIGVTWSDHAEASALRDALAVDGIDDIVLVSEGHAAASLAQAVGRAVGYDTTALLFINRDTATLSVVQTDDGSVVKVLSRTLHGADAMAVLTEMAAAVAAQKAPPQGIFVVGAGVDISSVKAHLEHLVPLPVNAPEDAELALARGAALASVAVPTYEASTVGLAYSQDPDGTTAGSVHAAPAGAETQLAPASAEVAELADDVVDEYAQTEARPVEEEHKPFLLVGSALTAVFVVGVVALAISLAVSIRPTADQRPSPAESVIVPSSQVAPPVQDAQRPIDPPPVETIKPPMPVVQQVPVQAPRTVYVERAPALAPPAPAPAAPPPVVAPPVVAPPVALPPPVVILPPSQWPLWRPSEDDVMWSPIAPQVPQSPQSPQFPQAPQQPQQSGGGSGSGDGSSDSGSSPGSTGSGSSGASSTSSDAGAGAGSGSVSSGASSNGAGPGSGTSGSSGAGSGSGASGSSGAGPGSGPSDSSGSSGSSSSGSSSSGSSGASSGSGSSGSGSSAGSGDGASSSSSSSTSSTSGGGGGSGGDSCFLMIC